MSSDKTVSLPPMVIGLGLAVMGFFANDFVEGRDNRTESVETVLREQLDLKLQPISITLSKLESDLRRMGDETRARIDSLRNSVTQVQQAEGLLEREIQSLTERVDRLSAIVRERSLELMK